MFFDTITNVNTNGYSFQEIEVWSSGVHDIERWEQKFKDNLFVVAELRNEIVGFTSLKDYNYIDLGWVDFNSWRRQGDFAGVEALLALALRALAGGADVHHQVGALDLLREGEGAGVEGVGELLAVLGDHAGPAAAGTVELDELDVEQRRDLLHRAVKLRGEAPAHAAGPVGNLHLPFLP